MGRAAGVGHRPGRGESRPPAPIRISPYPPIREGTLHGSTCRDRQQDGDGNLPWQRFPRIPRPLNIRTAWVGTLTDQLSIGHGAALEGVVNVPDTEELGTDLPPVPAPRSIRIEVYGAAAPPRLASAPSDAADGGNRNATDAMARIRAVCGARGRSSGEVNHGWLRTASWNFSTQKGEASLIRPRNPSLFDEFTTAAPRTTAFCERAAVRPCAAGAVLTVAPSHCSPPPAHAHELEQRALILANSHHRRLRF
jgi:hypothetical protein